MNKYQESFERIKEECSKLHNFDIVDDFINLKKLVDKTTPKKMGKIDKYESFSYYKCPVCHSIVGSTHRYCSNCGQRIDTIVGDEDE